MWIQLLPVTPITPKKSFEVLISLDNINESESAEAVQMQLAADINPNSKARGLI